MIKGTFSNNHIFFTHIYKREVTLEEGEKKASDTGVLFIETSAKAGHNVKSLFKRIALALPGMDNDANGIEEKDQLQKVDLNISEQTNSSSCAC